MEHWRAAWGAARLAVFERIGSTNDYARDWAEAGAPDGTVVLAEEQTEGRGRRGRRWHAPAHTALLISVVLRPGSPPAGGPAPGAAPLRVGLAAARALERIAGVPVRLEWPNDLVVGAGAAGAAGKIAGVLCEGVLAGGGPLYLVAGLGVNVAQRPEDWPPEIRDRAASLVAAAGRPLARAELAGELVRELHRIAPRIARPLEAAALEELDARDPLRGRRVRVDGRLLGTAAGVERDGALRVDTGDEILRVRSGTVRPVD